MTKKRYSVWSNEKKAKLVGPEYQAWQVAKHELDVLKRGVIQRNWRIWRHNDDGTVTDVTDGEPERWWFCAWDEDDGYEASKNTRTSITASLHWADGKLTSAHGRILSTTEPTAEQFQAHVLSETGVTVPCFEKEEWHLWDGEGWCKPTNSTPMPGVWRDNNGHWMATFYSTRSERTGKRDALLAAAKAAGKPEGES